MTLARVTLALRLTVLVILLGVPARAHEIERRTGAVCDTRGQAERLAGLLEQDAQAAVMAVNTEARDPSACAIANVAYVRGAKAGTARSKAGTFDIVEILVVGVDTRAG